MCRWGVIVFDTHSHTLKSTIPPPPLNVHKSKSVEEEEISTPFYKLSNSYFKTVLDIRGVRSTSSDWWGHVATSGRGKKLVQGGQGTEIFQCSMWDREKISKDFTILWIWYYVNFNWSEPVIDEKRTNEFFVFYISLFILILIINCDAQIQLFFSLNQDRRTYCCLLIIMIELHKLSLETSRSSLNARGSFAQLCTDDIKYTMSNIKDFLKKQPEKYILVDSHRVSIIKPPSCRIRFALPAIKDENDQNIIIGNFATCRSCYIIHLYINR